MKAVLIREYGGPDVLEIADVPDPAPEAGEVLVEVHAASVNPIDWKMRQGLVKEFFDVPLPHIMGRDMSGVVRAVGDGVTAVRPGEEVFGVGNPVRDGTHAELVSIAADLVAPKPATIGHPEAAALGVAALSALAALEETAALGAGETVLIHAGAGGVGAAAIQFAKHIGATVVATASQGNLDYVRGLGADEAVDYRDRDFSEVVRDCDVVLDSMGGEVHNRSFACLKPGGRLAFLTAAPIEGETPRRDVRVERVQVRGGRDRLARLAELADAGAIVAQINAAFPLAEARKAYDLSETGHARGKIVLKIR